jgi:pimeloyl-ACP methyl ester carboxylesterase
VDAASYVVSIADAMELDRFAVYGRSGGGMHTLACGTLPPRRVVAIALLASPAPYSAEGLDWSRGLAKENVAEMSAALKGETELERFLERQRAEYSSVTPEGVVAQLGSLVPPIDARILTNEFATFSLASIPEGFKGGVMGWRDDDLAIIKPRGLEVSEIKVPT